MAPNNDVNNAVQWLSADAAAHRLGVKIGTLYSYVSRGVIRSHPLSEGKGSRFDRAEVEGLLSRRRSQPGGGADTIVVSRITRLHEDGVRYRGHPVEDLAREQSFEEVASMLWDVAHDASPWLVVALPRVPMDDTVALSDRIRVAVTLAALRDEHRPDLRRESVVVSARTLIASVVASLPLTTTNTGPSTDQAWPKQALLSIGGHRRRASVAAALAARLGAQRMTPALVRAVNTALVLVADHELATSTLAARVAASTRADVYSAVLAGASCSGPLHVGASRGVAWLLRDAEQRGVATAVGEVLRDGRPVPGFGHKVYARDPRFRVLWEVLESSGLPGARIDLAARVVAFAAERVPVQPNIDFAGAALAFAAGMHTDAFEAVFLVARMAGWVAHTLEEYEEAPLRFRMRGLYVGSTN